MSDQRTGQDVQDLNARMMQSLLAQPPQELTPNSYALRVLQTRGRRTGTARRTPLGVTETAGQHYLVSPNLQRDWVRNLLEHPEAELLAGSQREPFRADRVLGDEAAAAIATYLAAVQVPWALEAFPIPADASRQDIAARSDLMAVFRVERPEGGGPA